MDDVFFDLLSGLRQSIQQQLRDALNAHDIPLQPFHGRVLSVVGRHPGVSARDLAERSGRDKAQIARLLKELEGQGFLARRPHPQDGRSQCLYLTAEGEAVFKIIQQQRNALLERMMRGVSAEDRAHLERILKLLSANLTE